MLSYLKNVWEIYLTFQILLNLTILLLGFIGQITINFLRQVLNKTLSNELMNLCFMNDLILLILYYDYFLVYYLYFVLQKSNSIQIYFLIWIQLGAKFIFYHTMRDLMIIKILSWENLEFIKLESLLISFGFWVFSF